VILQHRHEKVSLASGRVHCDGGPAIKYRDGFSIWALNGVTVPQWLAETPTGEIDPAKIATIENVQVRREFVKKVGADRICHKIGSKVHSAGDYDLMDLEVVPGQKRKYLKMNNPSVPGIVHFEAVHPDCNTVQKAINWRRYQNVDKEWNPNQLT
jgi:hypothetical protein